MANFKAILTKEIKFYIIQSESSVHKSTTVNFLLLFNEFHAFKILRSLWYCFVTFSDFNDSFNKNFTSIFISHDDSQSNSDFESTNIE